MINKKQNILFIVLAYAIFWILCIGAVVLFSGNEELFPKAIVFVQIVGTWAPTLALLIMFKKLYPSLTIKKFYKKAFEERLNYKILLVVTIAYLAITIGLVGIASFAKEVSFSSLFNFSFIGFIVTLFSGAMGEESGWRGHLQQSLEKKHDVLMSCLIIGIIWAFWHALTWIDFVSGMIYYIPLDILSKISFAFIIGICYSRCRNLLVPMWIHFVANILLNGIQAVVVDFYVLYVLLEVIVAIAYIVWYKRTSKKEIATA